MTRILFCGHDFKFARLLIDGLKARPGFIVTEHHTDGYVLDDPGTARALSEQADVVFCEWSLGNARWFSHNKRPGQVLVVRLHRHELGRPFLERTAWDAVDALVFIAPAKMESFLARFPDVAARSHVIPNLVDCDALDRTKAEEAATTLGLLGSAPRIKAPHLALDLLERVRARDPAFRLRIKGHHPWEYAWLWDKPAERAYYERLYERIGRLGDGVVTLDPHGDDVPDWFQGVGVILSTSELEGSHQAVAEGMASGSVPVIRPWVGADRVYPRRFVARTMDDAVGLITSGAPRAADEAAACRAYARRHFDRRVIVPRYEELFDSLLRAPRPPATRPRRSRWRRLARTAAGRR